VHVRTRPTFGAATELVRFLLFVGGNGTVRWIQVPDLIIHLTLPLVAFWALTQVAAEEAKRRDLTQLSLEELTGIEVTSVSKAEEPQAGAAAAVAVITNEDIRRTGVTSLPEALRLVPGLQVGRVSSSSWAVSSRGFSSVNSAKLLVLTDTRSLYTPLFSGVFWDVQDLLLADVDRIEVIRGPGAALWGSNAVNGVINVTTKSAKDTHGLYFEAGGGTYERGFGAVRYGDQIGERFHYRVFAHYFNRAAGYNPTGPESDNWWLGHIGFRSDFEPTSGDTLTVQGDLYRANMGQVKPSVSVLGRPGPQGRLVIRADGGNVLGRWRHALTTDSDFELRIYYDHTYRNDPTFLDELQTIDVDLQHHFRLPLRQEILWGASYRLMADHNEGKGLFELRPPESTDHVISGFIQDRIAILESLRLTLGTKLEHNDFSGFEIQPNGRIAWDVLADHTVWVAVSRAVRVPTRLERDVFITVSQTAQSALRLLGNKDFGSEKLLAYELGYRWHPASILFVDIAAFYNRYHGLASLELGMAYFDSQEGRTIIPLFNQNLTDGSAKGVEVAVTVTPVPIWRLSMSYSNLVLDVDPRGQDINRGQLLEGASPRHQVRVQSFLDLPARFQLDGFFRYVSSLPSSPEAPVGVQAEAAPAYATFDLRLSWLGWKPVEISVVGQSLDQAHHPEFPGGTQVARSVYAKVAGRF